MYYVNQIYNAGQVWYIVEERRREETVMEFPDAIVADMYADQLNGSTVTDDTTTTNQ